MFKIIIKSTGSMTQTWEAYTIPANKSSLPILYIYIFYVYMDLKLFICQNFYNSLS